MVVTGPVGSGKSSLISILTGAAMQPRLRQDVCYTRRAIDVPGAYLENSRLHQHLIALGQEALVILMLLEYGKKPDQYPPGFAAVFTVPVAAVITKIAGVKAPDAEAAGALFKQYAGIKGPVFTIDSGSIRGLDGLSSYLSGFNPKDQEVNR